MAKTPRSVIISKPAAISSTIIEESIVYEKIARENGLALIKALKCQEFSDARNLVCKAIDTSVIDDDGNTALHLAIEHKQWFVIGYILLSDAGSITTPNKLGFTPIDLINTTSTKLESILNKAKQSGSFPEIRKAELNFENCKQIQTSLGKLTKTLSTLPKTSTTKLSEQHVDDSGKEGKYKTSSKKPSSKPVILSEDSFSTIEAPKPKPFKTSTSFAVSINTNEDSFLAKVVIHTPKTAKSQAKETLDKPSSFSLEPDYIYGEPEEFSTSVTTIGSILH